MSAFWGGFASSLKGYMDQAQEDKRAQEAEQRKLDFLKELEKWKMENTIGETELDPKSGEVIYYNQAGKEMTRRPATQAQLEAYSSKKEESELSRRGLKAEVANKEFEAKNAPRTLEAQLAREAALTEGSYAQAAAARANAAQSSAMTDRIRSGADLAARGGGSGGMKDSDLLAYLKAKNEISDALASGISPVRVDEMGQPLPLSPEEKQGLLEQKKQIEREIAMRAGSPIPFSGGAGSTVTQPKYGTGQGMLR